MRFLVTYIPHSDRAGFCSWSLSRLLPRCVLQGFFDDLVELALEGAIVFDPALAFFGRLLSDGLGGPLSF